MSRKYTVIGYYSNTNERFASSISTISAQDAEVCVLNDVGGCTSPVVNCNNHEEW